MIKILILTRGIGVNSFLNISFLFLSLIVSTVNAKSSTTINGKTIILTGGEGITGTIVGGNCIEGNGNIVTQERPDISQKIRNICIEGCGELIVERAEPPTLKVKTDDNMLEHVATRVEGDTLYIEIKSDRCISPTELIYYLILPFIKSLDVAGTVDVTVDSLQGKEIKISTSGITSLKCQALSGVKVNVTTSGTSSVEARVSKTDDVTVQASGCSKINLSGEARRQRVTTSETAKYNAHDLRTDSAFVDGSGCSKIQVSVKDRIEGEVSEIAHLHIKGNPEINVSKSGIAGYSQN